MVTLSQESASLTHFFIHKSAKGIHQMWILSQYKDVLLDATMISLEENKILAGTVVKAREVGLYSSEDRARMIFEKLYTHMKNQTSKKVFEMPLG